MVVIVLFQTLAPQAGVFSLASTDLYLSFTGYLLSSKQLVITKGKGVGSENMFKPELLHL